MEAVGMYVLELFAVTKLSIKEGLSTRVLTVEIAHILACDYTYYSQMCVSKTLNS